MADEDPSRAWRGSTASLPERNEEALDDEEDEAGVMSMSDDEGEGSTRYVFLSVTRMIGELMSCDVDILLTSIMRIRGCRVRIRRWETSGLFRVGMKCDFLLTIDGSLFHFYSIREPLYHYFSTLAPIVQIVASDPRRLRRFDILIASFVSFSNDFSSATSLHSCAFLLTIRSRPSPIRIIPAKPTLNWSENESQPLKSKDSPV